VVAIEEGQLEVNALTTRNAAKRPMEQVTRESRYEPTAKEFDILREVQYLKPNISLHELLRQCPQMRTKVKANLDAMGNSIPTNLVEESKTAGPRNKLLCVKAKLNRTEVRALIDTGSSISMIPVSTAKDLGLNIQSIEPLQVSGITGHSTTIMGAALGEVIHIDGDQSKVDLYVLDRLPQSTHDLLLGNDWLTHAKATLNLARATLTLGNSKKEIALLTSNLATIDINALQIQNRAVDEQVEDQIPTPDNDCAKLDPEINSIVKNYPNLMKRITMNNLKSQITHGIDTQESPPTDWQRAKNSHSNKKWKSFSNRD
jgi:hypothetical protein